MNSIKRVICLSERARPYFTFMYDFSTETSFVLHRHEYLLMSANIF